MWLPSFPNRPRSHQVLSRPEYFGQFGRVVKVVGNRNYIPAGDGKPASSSAYVTFNNPQAAVDAIRACENFPLDGRILHCSYGTSKYCAVWLRGFPCHNPDCMFLHEEGDPEDSFTKEGMQTASRATFQDITRPPFWRGVPGSGPHAPPLPPPSAKPRNTVLPSVAERYYGLGPAIGCGYAPLPAAPSPPRVSAPPPPGLASTTSTPAVDESGPPTHDQEPTVEDATETADAHDDSECCVVCTVHVCHS